VIGKAVNTEDEDWTSSHLAPKRTLGRESVSGLGHFVDLDAS